MNNQEFKTSYHCFLDLSLIAAGVTKTGEFYSLNQQQPNIRSVFINVNMLLAAFVFAYVYT